MSTLAALYTEINKAGLITPGKRPLFQRVGFLLRSGKSDRHARIGRYLEGRKRGLGYGPKGKRRRRTGTYTGVYATGVNKSEIGMDAIDALYVEIEKAARGGPRSGMIPYGSRHQYGRAKFFEARAKRWGESKTPLAQRGSRARAYLANRYRGGKGPRGRVRTGNGGIYKSAELPMTDAIDELYDVIEKARGLMPRGGSSKMIRSLSRYKGGNGPRRRKALAYLADRNYTGRSPGRSQFRSAKPGKYK